MENEFPDLDTPNEPPPARDPLIRYSVFVALGCAAVCMLSTILYILVYNLGSTLSFERHFDSYVAAGNTANLSTVLGLHTAQNHMFLQSCGMVAGIFFAFLGLALFLVGIQGTVDASGHVKDYSASARRLAPGAIILLASMIFVGVSAMHSVDFELGPTPPTATILAPTAATTTAAPVQTTPSPSPATTAPSTQSQLQPAPVTPQPAHLAPQSATTTAVQPAATQPATAPVLHPIPAIAPAPAHRTARPALVSVNRKPSPAPQQHRFQP